MPTLVHKKKKKKKKQSRPANNLQATKEISKSLNSLEVKKEPYQSPKLPRRPRSVTEHSDSFSVTKKAFEKQGNISRQMHEDLIVLRKGKGIATKVYSVFVMNGFGKRSNQTENTF